jgi:trimethylamine---corrinoid protein Co-methyltransferase
VSKEREIKVFEDQLKLISDSQAKEIHQAALDILSQVGVKVFSKRALGLFEEKGVVITGESVVRMPKEMVEWAISRAPGHVLLAGRSEEFDLHLEKNRVYLGTGGAAINVYDVQKNETRPAQLSDLASFARLCDALENIHFFIRPVEPPHLSKVELDVHKFYICFANIRKHVMGAVYSKESAAKVIEMAATLAGGIEALRERPFVSFIGASISPLVFDPDGLEIVFEIIDAGLPVVLPSTPVAGSTGPATLAGLISLAHAEALAGITLAQLIRPGAPVLYGPIPRPVNWRNMRGLKGGVESGMMNAVMARLSHYIGIPQYADAGGTESKKPDIQAGYEAAANIMLVALAGGNYIHHAAGLVDSDLTACLEKYVVDDDICGLVIRALKGFTIDLEHLAFDVIEETGPGGNFLTEKHTLDHLRSGEIFIPWSASRGEAISALEKAAVRAQSILANHDPGVMDEDTDCRIRERFGLRFNRNGEPC